MKRAYYYENLGRQIPFVNEKYTLRREKERVFELIRKADAECVKHENVRFHGLDENAYGYLYNHRFHFADGSILDITNPSLGYNHPRGNPAEFAIGGEFYAYG